MRSCSTTAEPRSSACLPCTSPKKAEQDIELWKKQEAAAKEAESSPNGSEDQLDTKVPDVGRFPVLVHPLSIPSPENPTLLPCGSSWMRPGGSSLARCHCALWAESGEGQRSFSRWDVPFTPLCLHHSHPCRKPGGSRWI